MDNAAKNWTINWKQVGEYLLGRSTLIGVASLMLLMISGYATWHGMRDFIVGVSNAAIYATYFSAKAGARAAIHHDCGIGRDEAGVRGLLRAEQCGMAMAAVATDSEEPA